MPYLVSTKGDKMIAEKGDKIEVTYEKLYVILDKDKFAENFFIFYYFVSLD